MQVINHVSLMTSNLYCKCLSCSREIDIVYDKYIEWILDDDDRGIICMNFSEEIYNMNWENIKSYMEHIDVECIINDGKW